MKEFVRLSKLKKGDKIAILSPSFVAPGKWPHVYELGLKRLRETFGLEPIEFTTTSKIGASGEERAEDLMKAFGDPEIKGVISTLGGNDQVTYIKNLAKEPFINNPKPFFGYSDNTHFENFLWQCGIPSYYGAALFTQFAEQREIHAFTEKYLRRALFEEGEVQLEASNTYNDIGLNWNEIETLQQKRVYEQNTGWFWDGNRDGYGVSWGGCLESLDEILRHGINIPTMEEFENILLITETSEEIPSADYVHRVYRACGERGILERIRGVLVGRPKAWDFSNKKSKKEKESYREEQRKVVLNTIREYNSFIPVVQNLDFGHTDPQIPLPYGMPVRMMSKEQNIFATF